MLKAEVRRLRLAVSRSETAGEILGQSAAVRRMKDLIARAAPSQATVLITCAFDKIAKEDGLPR